MRKPTKIVSIVISVIVPFFLMMTAIRVLLIPYIYIEIEYHAPGFPEDPYGFTQADRLTWSKVSFDYLINDQPLSWLANQRLADGSPLYIDRELSHMLDVKNLIQAMFIAWWILLACIVVFGLVSWRMRLLKVYWRALSRGGWWTIALIAAVLVFVLVSFDWLFTNFHRIFFSGDSWLFLYSDTLIRLFPIRFWQDAFIWVGCITISLALIFGLVGSSLAKRAD